MNPPVADVAVEAQPFSAAPQAPTTDETQVFVSVDGRRSRFLKGLGQGMAALTVIWLAALLAGAFGLGRLPGVSLPQVASDPGGASPAAGSFPDGGSGPASGKAGGRASGHPGRRSAESASWSRQSGSLSGPALPGQSESGPSLRRGGSVVGSQPGRAGGGQSGGGASPGATKSPGAPAKPSKPSTPGLTTSPGKSSSAPGAAHRRGATASPSPTAMEHSHKWSTGGG
jgi:hypothetical protein